MKFDTKSSLLVAIVPPDSPIGRVDVTYKLYIGGKQKRATTTLNVYNDKKEIIGAVGKSNQDDILSAVDAAQKAQPGWAKLSGHNRGQILYYIAENLDRRRNEFISKLKLFPFHHELSAKAEFDAAIQQLFYWAAWCDKLHGTKIETGPAFCTVQSQEPRGTIGIICPDSKPLLAFISLVAMAISHGNSVVVVPSEKYPIPALDLYQVLDTSDVPGGVINILTGNNNVIAECLAGHHDVNAVWYFGSEDGCKKVEYASAENMKYTWTESRDLSPLTDTGIASAKATYSKTIWIPQGESFAN